MSPSSILAVLRKSALSAPVQGVAGAPRTAEGEAGEEAAATPSITKADVEPGDMLLLHYEPEANPVAEALKLLWLAKQAVEDWKHWADYDKQTREDHFHKLMPLIHFAITAFDGDKYFHAAIVGLDPSGKKVVIEAGPKGIMQTPLEDYWDGPISVCRYHRDGVSLGDKLLPADPVLKKAAALHDSGDIEYGYYHAGLLAIWCLFRAGEDTVMERLRVALIAAFGEPATDMLFKLIGADTIRLLLIDIFHKALDRWRQEKHLVCSEMVAVCFNQADDLGTYTISRELCKSARNSVAAEQHPDQPALSEDVESALRTLAGAFDGLEVDRPLRAVDVALALVSSDVLYTPSDLEQSVSTFNIGQM